MDKLRPKFTVGSTWATSIIVFLSITVIAILGTVIWALPRGFDWTDEAWAYSLIESNRITIGEPWGYQHLLHPIFNILGNSVLAFRILRLLGYVSIGILLSISFITFAKSRNWSLSKLQKSILIISSQFGTVIAFSYPPRYLTYNELASWASQLFIVLSVVAISYTMKGSYFKNSLKIEILLWTGIGILLTISFWAKITTFLILFVFAIAVLILFSYSIYEFAKRFAFLVFGALSSLFILFLWGFPYKEYIQNLNLIFFDEQARTEYDHPIGELLFAYFMSLKESVKASLPILLLLGVMLFISIVWSKNSRTRTAFLFLTNFVLVSTTIYVSLSWPRTHNWSLLGTTLFVLFILICFVSLFVSIKSFREYSFNKKSRKLQLVVQYFSIFAIACFAPLGAALGTNNPIMGQFIFTATSWVTFAVGLSIVASNYFVENKNVTSALGLQLTLGALSSIVVLAFLSDLTTSPYRIPLYKFQTTHNKAPYVSSLLLTPAQASWADWVSEQTTQFGAKDVPTVALDAPGALLIFNNSSVASPWVTAFWPVSAKSIPVGCSALEKPINDFFVIQDGESGEKNEWNSLVRSQLNQCGFNFPSDFIKVSQRLNPVSKRMTSIWRLSAQN